MIDHKVRTLCMMMGDLFKYSTTRKDCSSPVFVKQFLDSSVALRMTKPMFIYGCDSIPYLYTELMEEKNLSIGKIIYPENVMYWMGYLICATCILKNIKPREFYNIIKANELYMVYDAYHSLDVEDAIERILESKNYYNKYDLSLFRRIKEA